MVAKVLDSSVENYRCMICIPDDVYEMHMMYIEELMMNCVNV